MSKNPETPPPPTALELSAIPAMCTADEWSRLCRYSDFIEAAGVSMEAAIAVAGHYLGRDLSAKPPAPAKDF